MEKSASRDPKPNEFVIPDGEVYARVNPHTWEVIEFLMTKLEPVTLQDLDTDDRVCAICQLEYCISYDERQSRLPVKTVCGHIFCLNCIITWLNPLGYVNSTEDADSSSTGTDSEYDEGSTEDTDGDYDEGSTEDTDSLFSGTDGDYYEKPRNSCPICRNTFFSGVDSREPIEGLSTRIWFWDKIYAFVGVARSEKEEYFHNCLWNFLDFCFLYHTFDINEDVEIESLASSQHDLLYFAQSLKTQSLTPVQERLRKSLEKLGDANLANIVLDVGDRSQRFHVYDPSSKIIERRL